VAGDADDAVAFGERRRNVIENVRRIAEPRQQDKLWTGAAPVQHFQLHALVDRYRLDGVRRWIFPLCLSG
jgi:hypothetical protein